MNPWFNKHFTNRITNYFEKQSKHSLNILYLYVICYLREKDKVLSKDSLVIGEQHQVHPTIEANNINNNEQIPEADQWNCSLCTFKNEYSRKLCKMCEKGHRPEGS